MSKSMPLEKLLWLDLEMTGLDVEKEVIIEVAAIVTDMDFQALDQYHAVVKQPQSYIDAMDEWNKKHHGESGLIAKIPQGFEPARVEADLILLAEQHFKKQMIVLAGNSIMQDRLFLNKYFKKFSERLHYRMLDVTSWKILMKEKFKIHHEKKNSHRALDDIQESIAELKHYLSHIKV